MNRSDPTFRSASIRVLVITACSLVVIPVAKSEEAPPPRGQLALELLFEENLTDTSASGQNGTAHGSIAYADGRHGKCLAFDGRSWIDTGFMQSELRKDFTVECWVKPDDQQGTYADIFGNHVSEGLGLVLQQDGRTKNHFYGSYGAGNKQWVMTEPVALAAGRWQHVALVKTEQELRLYLNGVQVAAKEDTAPALPSPMPIAVGLGYTDKGRCFRGLVDDFRIWNVALTEFPHAGIDAAAAAEIRAQVLNSTPRPAAGPLVESWTLSTEDTRATLGVTAKGELVVRELSNPSATHNWIANPVPVRLWSQGEIDGQCTPLVWRFDGAVVKESDGRNVTIKLKCDKPTLVIESTWQAHKGPGPIRHTLQLKNLSSQTITIGEQPTFDLDLAGADTLWCFHSDGITPDPVGVYRFALGEDSAGDRHAIRTTPTGDFIPYVVFDANQKYGLYLGLEWSFCRIETVALPSQADLRVRAGNVADIRTEIPPGQSLEIRPGFVGTYCGDLDEAGNRLRRWLMHYCMPEIVRRDTSYPKVQWNAFGATGKAPGSWDPVESKYYPLIDDIAPLGFEEVMIDVGWWQDGEPDSDRADWPSGMKKAADYAHERGMRFGLYWTDDLDMADAAQRRQRADRIRRLFRQYGTDMWRSDCTRGEVIGASFAATRGFYEMVDTLAAEIPEFQWENCSGGGRIKDYGAMRRAVKIFNSDTYSALHVRQAFFDSSYAMHPAQLEGHLGSTDGRYRPRGVTGIRYAFRSTSLGAPEWFLDAPNGGNGSEPWTQEEKDTLKSCVDTYKSKIRPLVRNADLHHVLPRPDGLNRDGIEYYDPASGQGLLALFQPSGESSPELIRLKGLDADRNYRVTFHDGTNATTVKSGKELMRQGLQVTLDGQEVSELVFFETTTQ